MNVEFPRGDELRTVTDVDIEDYPRVAVAHRERELDPIEDLDRATGEAVDNLPLADLPTGAEIGVTAGSRGIKDKPDVLRAAVAHLRAHDYEPFVLAAMGSHGGATADGQRGILAALGITEESIGCEIRTSMEIEHVGHDDDGRDVYVATDALEADGVIIANRVKPHTDFSGPVESGLCKMAVVGLGKHHGAGELHMAGLADDFSKAIIDRTEVILEAAPVIGGLALIEDANERITHLEGVPADRIIERDQALLEIAYEELPMLPVDQLDALIVDEIGKDISGTGMDTNVLGRYRFLGQPEPTGPDVSRVYARRITPASHGNAIGLGLADLIHEELLTEATFEDTYINIATAGEPERAKIPFVVPDDRTALALLPAMVGCDDPGDLRLARIRNTLEPDHLIVTEPVARELAEREDVTVGELTPLELTGGELQPELL